MAIERRPFADAEAAGLIERFDPFEGYERFVRRTLDLDALKAADVHVLVEPLWGSGASWISRLLAGGRIRITEIHQERNPYFGGVNPEPIRPNVDEALAMLGRGGYDMGLLLDGDADRAGAADERGTFIHQLQVTGLLVYYLAEHRGLRQPVVVSVNNTSMAGRLGERYGLEVYETSVGFKYIGPRMIETGAMIGGEESGGFGFGMHLPERDGLLSALLVLESVVASGTTLSDLLRSLEAEAGAAAYRRRDYTLHPDLGRRLVARLETAPLERLGARQVMRVENLDGRKYWLDDGAWVLVRPSGTEPLLRIYVEAPTAQEVDELHAAAEALVARLTAR